MWHSGRVQRGRGQHVSCRWAKGDLNPGARASLPALSDWTRQRVDSGAYASASEVLRAAMRALEREEGALKAWLNQRVDGAFADDRPNIPARDVFKRLKQRHPRTAAARRK